MKLAKFSAKLVANFRRSLEGDFRASFAGENRQKHFPPKLHRKFHHQTSLRGSGLWRALLPTYEHVRRTKNQEVSEYGFVYGSKRQKSQFLVHSQLRTQLRKQPPQSSSKENFFVRVRLRRLSEYGSVACLVERPTWETRAEQYSDTTLKKVSTSTTAALFSKMALTGQRIAMVETPRPLRTAPHGQSIIILRCLCGPSNRSRGVQLHPDTVATVSSYVQEPHAIIFRKWRSATKRLKKPKGVAISRHHRALGLVKGVFKQVTSA